MAGTLTVGRPATVSLPKVRQDLMIYPAEADADGTPLWHLHDPLANKFYRLEERDVQLLAIVGHRSAAEVSYIANKYLKTKVDEADVEELVGFLRTNNLVVCDEVQKTHYRQALETMGQKEWWELMLKNPIVFRIPIWHPDKFLERTLPYVRWIGSKASITTFVIITLIGFYLVSRQVDQFFTTFEHFFNLSGLAIYFGILFFVKILHELGHAYAAKQLGCRVPVIGVAFLVGWPVFYTDTSDAWKIADRSKRLAIGSAGVGVELVVASLSLLLWSLSPEGVLKSAFFLLATTTWILSIVVNFNPLMRFDGYYLFSDWMRVPNLEKRSFELARWQIRESIFGFGDKAPEPVRRWMIFFAFGVWVYRFFLFLGIALLLYQYFFRAVGVALFVLQIFLLLIRPTLREFEVWWSMRDRMHLNKFTIRSSLILCFVVGLVFIPWRTSVPAPALIEGRISEIYSPQAGRLQSNLIEGQSIKEGDTVFTLSSPSIDHEFEMVRARYDELRWTYASLGFDTQMRSEATIIGSALRTQNQRLRSLFEQRELLDIKAPFDGTLVDVVPDISPGEWLPKGVRLATVVDRDDVRVSAYLLEEELSRVEVGMTAKFYPENPEFPTVNATVSSISFSGSGQLDKLYLASLFGGDIAVREARDGSLKMVQSHYLIELQVDQNEEFPMQVVRGNIQINGHAISPFSQIKRRFISLVVRESGF
jgi:putative peptide zinc metalloprotease protein